MVRVVFFCDGKLFEKLFAEDVTDVKCLHIFSPLKGLLTYVSHPKHFLPPVKKIVLIGHEST